MSSRQKEIDRTPKTCPIGGEEKGHWARYCHDHECYMDPEANRRHGIHVPGQEEPDAPAPAGVPGVKVSEEEIRRGITEFLQMQGFSVWDLEQGHRPRTCKHCDGKIPGGSRQTQGLADLLIVYDGYVGFVECKSADGVLRPEQRIFSGEVDARGGVDVHVWRSSADAARWFQRWKRGER